MRSKLETAAMLTLILALLLVAYWGAIGRHFHSPPRTSPQWQEDIPFIQSQGTFTLSIPPSTKLKQGESTTIAIGIKPSKGFVEHVTLKFENLPKGVTIERSVPMSDVDVKPEDLFEALNALDHTEEVAIKAADNADLGDFTVKVIGHTKQGAQVKYDLKLTVEKK